MTRALMRIESLITIPCFVIAWLVCATGFALKAGYLMAKAEGADKRAILDATLKAGK